ncbi:MAG: helix-turn-helix domain-containing protein, partial [Bifidobacteriaceae bacterium]|nr:helix-turn-helix domain-containing protein [Bifidobacteriaceae bacterium]
MRHPLRLWLLTYDQERGCTSLPAHCAHLSLDKRVQIEKHLDAGKSVRQTARILGRC